MKRYREKFATTQADCLALKAYSLDEKLDLKNAILKLSDTTLTKIYLWLYENHFGPVVKIYVNGIKKIKSIAKKVVLKLSEKK